MTLDVVTTQGTKPSAATIDFLRPLNSSTYIACGAARLLGVEELLIEEALRRGRIADSGDYFELIATEDSLIYCRVSLGFAIQSPWSALHIRRERGYRNEVVRLEVDWPRHGRLRFEVSPGLADRVVQIWRSNIDTLARLRRSSHSRSDSTGGPVGRSVGSRKGQNVEGRNDDTSNGGGLSVSAAAEDWEPAELGVASDAHDGGSRSGVDEARSAPGSLTNGALTDVETAPRPVRPTNTDPKVGPPTIVLSRSKLLTRSNGSSSSSQMVINQEFDAASELASEMTIRFDPAAVKAEFRAFEARYSIEERSLPAAVDDDERARPPVGERYANALLRNDSLAAQGANAADLYTLNLERSQDKIHPFWWLGRVDPGVRGAAVLLTIAVLSGVWVSIGLGQIAEDTDSVPAQESRISSEPVIEEPVVATSADQQFAGVDSSVDVPFVQCDPNYGGCLPQHSSDGTGVLFVCEAQVVTTEIAGTEQARFLVPSQTAVLGTDVHNLDKNGDRIACGTGD